MKASAFARLFLLAAAAGVRAQTVESALDDSSSGSTDGGLSNYFCDQKTCKACDLGMCNTTSAVYNVHDCSGNCKGSDSFLSNPVAIVIIAMVVLAVLVSGFMVCRKQCNPPKNRRGPQDLEDPLANW